MDSFDFDCPHKVCDLRTINSSLEPISVDQSSDRWFATAHEDHDTALKYEETPCTTDSKAEPGIRVKVPTLSKTAVRKVLSVVADVENQLPVPAVPQKVTVCMTKPTLSKPMKAVTKVEVVGNLKVPAGTGEKKESSKRSAENSATGPTNLQNKSSAAADLSDMLKRHNKKFKSTQYEPSR
jgi:hypothetical protein